MPEAMQLKIDTLEAVLRQIANLNSPIPGPSLTLNNWAKEGEGKYLFNFGTADITPIVTKRRTEAACRGAAESLRTVASFVENMITVGQPLTVSDVIDVMRELVEKLDHSDLSKSN